MLRYICYFSKMSLKTDLNFSFEIFGSKYDYRFLAAVYRTMLPGPLISTTHLTCLNRLKMVRRAASDLKEEQFLRSSAMMK